MYPTAPGFSCVLFADVVAPRATVEPPRLQAALLESGVLNHTGKDHYARAFPEALCLRVQKRCPRFTRVSLGKPFRRLLVLSKAREVVVAVSVCHGTPPFVNAAQSGPGGVSLYT